MNIQEFKTYWEVYSWVKNHTQSREEFFLQMQIARNLWLDRNKKDGKKV